MRSFTIPNRAEGYTTDDNARALIFTVLLEELGMDQLNVSPIGTAESPIRTGRSAISRSSNTLSMRTRSDSVTFLAITTAGWKKRDRKIHTPRALGSGERCWPESANQGFARRDRTFI